MKGISRKEKEKEKTTAGSLSFGTSVNTKKEKKLETSVRLSICTSGNNHKIGVFPICKLWRRSYKRENKRKEKESRTLSTPGWSCRFLTLLFF